MSLVVCPALSWCELERIPATFLHFVKVEDWITTTKKTLRNKRKPTLHKNTREMGAIYFKRRRHKLGASGKTLDLKYLTKRKEEEQWSTMVFPKEKPPQRDFAFWKLALRQVVPIGGISDRLGRFINRGYKIWDWR